jgi:uncharacterized membrane protein
VRDTTLNSDNKLRQQTPTTNSDNKLQAVRLPLQAMLIAWAWWYTGKNRRDRGDR